MSDCARLSDHSVVICKTCRTFDGFLPCPQEAQGKLIATYPPVAYYQAAAALRRERQSSPVQIPTPTPTPSPAPTPAYGPPKLVYSGGYTGSICDQCGSTRMRRSGTCETCEECGHAGGCG